MKRITVLHVARKELDDAVHYYDGQRPGLGDEFIDEFEKSLQLIRSHPTAWTQLSKRTRRCRMSRFPYGVLYQVKPDHLRVIAVMHLSRRPQYWRDRERDVS